MDIVRATAAAYGRAPIANVHDAIFFKQRLGAELKAEVEWQMRAQTGNAYWHLTLRNCAVMKLGTWMQLPKKLPTNST